MKPAQGDWRDPGCSVTERMDEAFCFRMSAIASAEVAMSLGSSLPSELHIYQKSSHFVSRKRIFQ